MRVTLGAEDNTQLFGMKRLGILSPLKKLMVILTTWIEPCEHVFLDFS